VLIIPLHPGRTWAKIETDSKAMVRAYVDALHDETRLKAPTKHLRDYYCHRLEQNTRDKAALRTVSSSFTRSALPTRSENKATAGQYRIRPALP
jgi:hypothetical protein